MTLYHGTNAEFDTIDLTKSKKYKDFGQGFYLSADRHQAERIAQQRVLIEGGSPVVMTFEYDEEAAKSDPAVRILTFPEYSTDWAMFINKNRNTRHSGRQHEYDIVYGPIADDKVGLQVKLFNQEIIDVVTLMERLKYIVPTFQYYFGTTNALRFLKKK